MLYLLGGAARAGKSMIARKFLAQSGIPFFSLDFLMMGFANGLPAYGVDPEADELLIGELLWPVVQSMARAMVEEEIDYLLEGVQLPPPRVAALGAELPGQVRACFVGLAEADTRLKFQEIRRFGGGVDDWLRAATDQEVVQEIERLKALSRRIKEVCRQHGLPYFEMSGDLPGMVEKVVQYLLGRSPCPA